MIDSWNAKALKLITAPLFLVWGSAALAAMEFYVSPAGSDENEGSLEAPFQSLARARDEIRRLKPVSDVSVFLREGTHRLTETFVLGVEDSAPQGHRITYQGFAEEEAVLSSGVSITGWKKIKGTLAGLPAVSRGKVWEADLPAELGLFYTLYDEGSRLPRARAQGFVPTTDIHTRDNPDKSLDQYTLHYPEGAVKNWPNLQDIELLIIPTWPWTMNILPLASVNESQKIARTTVPGTYQLSDMVSYSRGKSGYESTCWIENVIEGLDSPGEWVVNTQKRKIYLWPKGETPGPHIEAPALRELVRIEGKNDQHGTQDIPVRGIHLRDLTFTVADRGIWIEGDRGIQHDWEVLDKDNAMLRFRGASDCAVERCHFLNAGGNGIRLDLYAQRIRVKDSYFHHLGQSAVMMLGYGPGIKDVNKYNEILNNHIHHCGEIHWHSQMITAWQSGHNRIAHNYLHHIPRKAICISGVREHWLRKDPAIRQCASTIRWNEIGQVSSYEDLLPFLHAKNNLVELNEIHDALQMLGDGSAINLSGGGLGNIIRQNYVHDIDALNPSSAIRMDGSQSGVLAENNIIVNMSVAAIIPKGDNTLRNNFIINVNNYKKTYGVIRGLGRTQGLASIDHNIFYNPSGKKPFLGYQEIDQYSRELFERIDHNLYFNPDIPEAERITLALLKEKGADRYSQYVDTLFKDWENGDFTLLPDSPALKMGIQQIDMSQVGLTSDFPSRWRGALR